MTEPDWSEAEEVGVAWVDNLRADNQFVATDNNGNYWKDTYPAGSVEAAYAGEDDDEAERIEKPEGITFYPVEITGYYYGRRGNEDDFSMGDTPGETLIGLSFPEQSLNHENVTDAKTVEEQVIDVLSTLDGGVYITDIIDRFNKDALEEPTPDKDELISILSGMADDNKVRRARGDYDTWWDVR